ASASGPWALLGFGFSWIGFGFCFGFSIWAFNRRILVVISLGFGYVSAVISPWALDWFPLQTYIE
ncbi:hypothetical protein RhiirA1_482039, partial [Rhizophagus irregularis]